MGNIAREPGRLLRMRKARNRAAPPVDFEEFWVKSLDRVLTIPPQPRFSMPNGGRTSVSLLDLDSWEGRTVRAWFSGPRRSPGECSPRPLLVTSHGYGSAVEPERVRRLASFGMDVVGVDVRGFGRSRDALPGVSPYGYVLTGSARPEESVLLGATCDFLQAYRAARDWFGVPSWVTFQGFSFAGGLAMMAASVLCMGAQTMGSTLDPHPPDVLSIGMPSFGYFEKRLLQCEAGSGREVADYLRQHPEKRHAIARAFSYFDATFFAPYLSPEAGGHLSRILLGVGAFDPVVPPETVYAIANGMTARPELYEMPCSHTSRPEETEWVRWEGAWIRAALDKPQGGASGAPYVNG